MKPSSQGDTTADAERYYEDGFWRSESLWSDIEGILGTDVDHTAFQAGERRLSRAELAVAAGGLARRLAEMGVSAGDVVALLGRNSLEAVVALVACVRLGAILAPVPPMFSASQLSTLMAQCDGRALVAFGGEREIAKCAGMPAGNHRFLAFTPELLNVLLEAAPTSEAPTPLEPDEPNLLLHSSGTTSTPKGIVHSGNTLRYATEQMRERWELSGEDVYLVVCEFGFVGSLLFGYFPALLSGAPCVLMSRWEPEDALFLLEREGCTYVLMMPTHVSDVLNGADPAQHDFSALRALAAPGLTAERRAAVLRRFGRPPLADYGLSEVPGNCAHELSESPEKMLKTEGRPYRGTEIRIVSGSGDPLATGEEGQIEINGPSRFLEFLGNEELTRSLIAHWGGYRTGDLGYLDEDGHLVYIGRSKDTIERAGVQIIPSDVEPYLLEHPAVREVALVPLPDSRLGERACAAVILADGAQAPTLEELRVFLQARDVAKYTWPESIEIFDEFPRTSSLKPIKGEIAELVLARGEDAEASG